MLLYYFDPAGVAVFAASGVLASRDRDLDVLGVIVVAAITAPAPDSFYNTRREQLARLAARHAIPAVYSVRNYVEAGGLMSYGPDIAAMFHRVGAYAARILGGKKPEDLPVEQVTRFELVINIRTAKSLAITIPAPLLLRADDVIQ